MAYLEYNPHGTLFHYTGIAGFRGIVSSRRLWFSDVLKTNDPREIHLGQGMLLEAIAHVRKNYFSGVDGAILDTFSEHINRYLAKHGMMSCSFSHHGDMLPMWREYSENCSGVSIGFRRRAIADMPIRIQKVTYFPDPISGSFVNLVKAIFKPLVVAGATELSIGTVGAFSELIASVIATKHDSWNYEHEIRGSFAASGGDGTFEFNGVPIPSFTYPDGVDFLSNVKSRKVGNKSIGFVELPFGKYSRGEHNAARAIEKVILGPKSELNFDEVEEVMIDAGFSDFEIVRSACQIR